MKIGLLGTGYMPLFAYLPAFRQQGAQISAIWGRHTARVQALASEHGIPRAYTDYQALIADPNVDALVLATPNHLHHPMLLAIAEAGKPVLCEKPLALNLAEAKEMAAAVNRAKLSHAIAFIWRLPAQAQQVKRLIVDGFLGDHIYQIQGVFAVSLWATPDVSLNWRGVRATGGEGVLADFGGHLGDLVNWYSQPISRVVAQAHTHIPHRLLPDGTTEPVETPDACNLLFQTAGGGQGTFHMSYISPARPLLLRLELLGERGVIHYELEIEGDLLQTRLGKFQYGDSGLVWEHKTEPFADIMARLCAGFLRGIAGEQTDLPTMQDGLQAQALIEAATNSLASGSWATVPVVD